jgi:hypothetical protein
VAPGFSKVLEEGRSPHPSLQLLYVGSKDALKFSYRAAGIPVEYEIPVVTTAMHFSGRREWLVCPHCQQRFAILYIVKDRFRCRRCHGLAYRTSMSTPTAGC